MTDTFPYLLFSITGENTEDDSRIICTSEIHNPSSRLRRDIVKVRSLTTDDHSESKYEIIVISLKEFTRESRYLKCSWHRIRRNPLKSEWLEKCTILLFELLCVGGIEFWHDERDMYISIEWCYISESRAVIWHTSIINARTYRWGMRVSPSPAAYFLRFSHKIVVLLLFLISRKETRT